MNNSQPWLGTFLLLWAFVFLPIIGIKAQSESKSKQENKQEREANVQPSPAANASSEEIAEMIGLLAMDDYKRRSSASGRLEALRDVALEPVLAHSLSVKSKFGSAAECLNLLEKWLRNFDPKYHDRASRLLDEYCADGTQNKKAESLIRRFLDEDYDCTESEAVVLLSTMGASIHWITDQEYFSIRMRSGCSRENGDSLWPLRKINSACRVLFEDEHTIDDYTARNLARAPGLVELFCPKMTEEQVRMLGESKSLKKIYLRECVTDAATIRALAKIPTLETLSFNKTQSLELLKQLHLFPALKQVHTNRSNVKDPKLLDYLAACPNLEELDLSSFKMPCEGLQDFHRFEKAKKLKLPLRADNTLVKNVAAMPALEVIEMNRSIITDEAAPYLAQHKNLRELSIEHTFISDESCQYLAKLTSLESLKLDATFVSPEGVALIENAIPGLEVKGWITAAHEPNYVKALQELQLVGCTVKPDFSVSFKRDDAGKVILPYRRVPGCELFFAVSGDQAENDRFIEAAKKVDDLKSLRVIGGDDAFAELLFQIPAKNVKVNFVESKVSSRTQRRLETHFRKRGNPLNLPGPRKSSR